MDDIERVISFDEVLTMSGKAKVKSNYKARGSSVDLYCSVHVHRAKGRSKSSCKVSTRGKRR